MKMSKELYDEFKELMTEKMEKVTAEKLVAYREHLQANEEYKDLDTRFAWDILHSCDQAKKARLFDKSYHQDLFDNHIGTAIRHIVKSFLKNNTRRDP